MLLTESRRAARTTAGGELVLLDEQDRSRWDRDLMAEGTALVEQALGSRRFGPYTLQAAIAAVHAEAREARDTDWSQIVGLYDVLAKADPSPVVELNRAAAVAMRDGPEAGLSLIEAILVRGDLARYQPAHAARAELCRRLGRTTEAHASYQRLSPLPGRSLNGGFWSGGWLRLGRSRGRPARKAGILRISASSPRRHEAHGGTQNGSVLQAAILVR